MHRKASPNSTNSGSGCSGLHGDNTQFMNAAFQSSALVVRRRRVGIMSIPTVPTNTTSKFHLFSGNKSSPVRPNWFLSSHCHGNHGTAVPWHPHNLCTCFGKHTNSVGLILSVQALCLSGIFSTKHRQGEAKPDADGRLPIRIPPEPCRCFGMGIPERQFFFPYRRRRLGIINVPTAPTNTTGIFSKLKWQVNSSECQRSCRIPSAII